jgi:hypothetical protein
MTIKKPSLINDALRAALIKKALDFPEGRAMIGRSMIDPIRRRLDYASISRKALSVEQLGFFCEKCKFTHVDVAHVHSDEECLTASVHLS